MDFNDLMSKAQAFESKYKDNKKKPVTTRKIHRNLPKLDKSKLPDEAVISEYMDVLRKTQENIGKQLYRERLEGKKEKKFNNPNYLKHQLQSNKRKDSLRRRIQMMRKQAIFPQPKSYTNYRNRNGLLKKNSIKIKL